MKDCLRYTHWLNLWNLLPDGSPFKTHTSNFPASIQENIADEMGFDIRTSRRQRDPKFRQMVLRAYNYQCAICGFNMRHDNAPIALEAAHIR